MMNNRHLFVSSLFVLMLSANQSKAFFPSFEMIEGGQAIQVVKTAKESVKNTKESLNELTTTLEQLKGSMGSLLEFAKALGFDPGPIEDYISKATEYVNNATNADVNFKKDIDGQISGITNGHVTTTEGAVNELEKLLEEGEEYKKMLEEYQSRVNQEKQNQENPSDEKNTPVEEEEEEEEIDDAQTLSAVNKIISIATDELQQANVMLNDYLDVSINKLNTNQEQLENAIVEIQKYVENYNQFSTEEKAMLVADLDKIKDKNIQLYQKMIASVEANKYDYNVEYNSKIKDGFGNYKKVVEAYVYGDVSKDKMLSEGKELIKKVNSVSMKLKKTNSDEFEVAASLIKNDLDIINKKIEDIKSKKALN